MLQLHLMGPVIAACGATHTALKRPTGSERKPPSLLDVQSAYFFFLGRAWDSALPAADFELALVRPSRSTLDAALAAVEEVTFLGALVCESALPPAVLEVLLVLLLAIVFDAADAAFG